MEISLNLRLFQLGMNALKAAWSFGEFALV
jgi:hypothetical protein